MSESTEHEELVDETPSEDAVGGAPAEGADEEDTAVAPAADADGQRSRKDEREEELVAEGDIAADYLEELLDIADMDGDIDTYTEGDRAHVSVVTEDETLVGRDGEVLEALQELSRLAVMTETGHRSRLMLDIAGHREKRRKELQLLAQDAINEVNETGEPVRLSPMNPFERKIVHDAVAAAGLFSESEGTEPQRRVVVQPAR
ncbi:MAG: protein jag [Propionibacterium acidifaciens]